MPNDESCLAEMVDEVVNLKRRYGSALKAIAAGTGPYATLATDALGDGTFVPPQGVYRLKVNKQQVAAYSSHRDAMMVFTIVAALLGTTAIVEVVEDI